MTALTVEARRERIQAALDAHAPTDERRSFPWKDGTETFDVVDIPLDAVVLNPHSHRIKPYLESHEQAELIAADPFTPEAQDLIADTIRSQIQHFDDLKANLREGQREPGIVTRDGLLVNANRRAVALRDLGRDYIQVAVLPADAGQREIDQLELQLQVERTFREDYTFSARLLFVHDLVTDHHLSAERIARMLGWAASDDERELRRGAAQVQQHLRSLAMIREVQTRSENRIPIALFDQKEQSFIELDAAMQQLGDEEAARRLRDMRLVAMLVGQGYSPLREMDAEFVGDHLYPVLLDDPVFGPAADILTAPIGASSEAMPAGLDLLADLGETTERDAGPLLDLVIRAYRDRSVVIPESNNITMDPDVLGGALNGLIGGATEDAQETRRHWNDLTAPITYMTAAIDKLRRANDRLDRAEGLPGFDKAKMQYVTQRAARMAEALRRRAEGL